MTSLLRPCHHDLDGPPYDLEFRHRIPIAVESYRVGDDGLPLMYHGFYPAFGGLALCKRPLEISWRRNLRYCDGCGKEFSNPWVPVCESCWTQYVTDSDPYIGWQQVIDMDVRTLPVWTIRWFALNEKPWEA